MSERTGDEPQLGGQPQTTGREPGLARLHQQRYEEMTPEELIESMSQEQAYAFAFDCAEMIIGLVDNPDPRLTDVLSRMRKNTDDIEVLGDRWWTIRGEAGRLVRDLDCLNHPDTDEFWLDFGARYTVLHCTEWAHTAAKQAAGASSYAMSTDLPGKWWPELEMLPWHRLRAIEYLTGKVK